jgi:hypothetical protein
MALRDEDLFDFNPDRIEEFDPARARQLLSEHGDVYRGHLAVAKILDIHRDRAAEDDTPKGGDWHEGYIFAVEDIAAHLRKGDYLPGADFYPNSA